MKRAAPWPLPQLLAENRNALTVYGALRWLAGNRRQVRTTRARIAEVCGLYKDTITAAVAALGTAGWVRVGHGHVPERRWYRLTFPTQGFFPVLRLAGENPLKRTRRLLKKPAQARPEKGVRLGWKNPPNPLTGIGAPPAAAPLPLEGARRAAVAREAPPLATGVLDDRNVPF